MTEKEILDALYNACIEASKNVNILKLSCFVSNWSQQKRKNYVR